MAILRIDELTSINVNSIDPVTQFTAVAATGAETLKATHQSVVNKALNRTDNVSGAAASTVITAQTSTGSTGGNIILTPGQSASSSSGAVVVVSPAATSSVPAFLVKNSVDQNILTLNNSGVFSIGTNSVPNGTSVRSIIVGQNTLLSNQIFEYAALFGQNNVVGCYQSLLAGQNNTGSTNNASIQDSIIAGSNNNINSITVGDVTILGDSNVITGGSGQNAKILGDSNTICGKGAVVGSNNNLQHAGTEFAFVIGRQNQSLDASFVAGSQNTAISAVQSGIVGKTGQSYAIGDSNDVVGSDCYAYGNNQTIGLYLATTSIGSNQYQISGDYTAAFARSSNKVFLRYNSSDNTICGEWLAASNIAFVESFTNFNLAAPLEPVSPTSPNYFIGFLDTTNSHAFGFNNTIQNSDNVNIYGRNNTVDNNNSNLSIYGNGLIIPADDSGWTVFGSSSRARIESGAYVQNNSTTVNRPSNVNSLTVDANGNVAIQNNTLNAPILLVDQTSNVTINSISQFGSTASVTNGTEVRIINIGTSSITLSKDNASGAAGYRLYWNQSGNTLALNQNHTAKLIYIDSLPLSGSTGGWLLIPDGI